MLKIKRHFVPQIFLKQQNMKEQTRTTSGSTQANLFNFIHNLIGKDEGVVQIKFASKADDLVLFASTAKQELFKENALKMHFLEINGHAPNIDKGIRYPIFNDAILCTSAGLDPEKSMNVFLTTIAKIQGIDIVNVVNRLQKENVIFPPKLLEKIVIV